MTSTITELMKANLHAVFGERDASARWAAIRATYSEDITFADDEGMVTGHEALSAKAQSLLDRAPGFVFLEDGPVYEVYDLGVLAWTLGPPGSEPVVSGLDIGTVLDGRITTLHTVITHVA